MSNKKDDAMKLALEFNRYFTSANGVDVPHRISVPRDEWREVYAAFREALMSVPDGADSALDRMAENAIELGLDYEPPCKTGSQCTSKCQQCERPARQQEPVADVVSGKTFDQFVALNEANAARVLELDELCETLQEKTYSQAMRIAELEAQLSQPAQQREPAGYFRLREYGSALILDQVSEDAKHNEGVFPLYASPQPSISAGPITPAMMQGPTLEQNAQMVSAMSKLAEQPAQEEPKRWVGLNVEQRAAIAEANNMLVDDDLFDEIEAKLKEKNNG